MGFDFREYSARRVELLSRFGTKSVLELWAEEEEKIAAREGRAIDKAAHREEYRQWEEKVAALKKEKEDRKRGAGGVSGLP